MNAGKLLKKIREDIFGESVRSFSEKLSMHYTTYHNYENNRFGKKPLQLIREISIGVSELVYSDNLAKSKIKEVILDFFLNSFTGSSQDFNYLFTINIKSKKYMVEFINYSFLLAHTGQHSSKQIISEDQFHRQQRYCINKLITLRNPKNAITIGHVEDYNLHMQIAYDNSETNFNCMLDGCTNSIENIIGNRCISIDIRNFSALIKSVTNYVRFNKLPEFILIYYFLHHIQREVDKIRFLTLLYDNMQKGDFVCIADIFFEDNDPEHANFKNRWNMVKEDTYFQKFWMSLSGLDEKSLEYSNTNALNTKNAMRTIGENYLNGINEYPISFEWLKSISKEIGYTIVLHNKINCFSDGIFLLKK